jgi:hypothetical protein
LDGNGSQEVVVVGHVKGPGNLDVKLNSALLVLNSDGTRFPGWQSAALGSGLLAQADLPWQGAAVGDLNSDGQLEIVVATEDGYIRAYRSNSNQPIWAFNYTQGATLFGTDPVIGDIDDDGALEILFGTYVPELNGTDKDGPIGLWALEANGSIVQGFPLPVPTPGMRSAPTLADLDKDGFVDILAATRGGHILVWDTPTRYDPTRLPWPTGRHDNRRTATYTSLNPLEGSDLWASPILLKQNEIVTFTVRILSSSSLGGAVSMADTLPPGLAFVDGSLHASAGSASYSGGTITWSGNANPGTPVDVTFGARVITSSPQSIQNAAVISAPGAGTVSRSAIIYVNFRNVHLPATFR